MKTPAPSDPAKEAGWLPDAPQFWQAAAVNTMIALKQMMAHYDDLCKSNPGFMGKMCLQNYGLWNQALLSSERAIGEFGHIVTEEQCKLT